MKIKGIMTPEPARDGRLMTMHQLERRSVHVTRSGAYPQSPS
jgi:hypothetical protein